MVPEGRNLFLTQVLQIPLWLFCQEEEEGGLTAGLFLKFIKRKQRKPHAGIIMKVWKLSDPNYHKIQIEQALSNSSFCLAREFACRIKK